MMHSVTINPSTLLILLTSVFMILSLFSSPGGGAHGIGDDAVSWSSWRSLLQANNGVNSTSLVLAEERTHRKDPSDDLNYYSGGWNISNTHYWTSVAYTGSPLFLVAAIWFVGFGLFLLLVSMYLCCCRRRPYGYSRFAYALSLILLSLFTIAAIVGAVVLYTGQGKFHDSTTSTLDYVVREANSTVESLKNVSSFLVAAKSIGVDQVYLPQDLLNKIDNVNSMITTAAETLDHETNKNKDDIFRYLDIVRLILIIVAAVMLSLALLGFLLSIVGLQCLVYTLVIIGWILVAVTFILCGIFLVLHNVVGDTCVAMNDWVSNPTAHTALDDIIPCVDSATAQESLSRSKDVTFQMVGLVNVVIANISNANNIPPSAGPTLSYNQSGPLMPLLCNPYNPDTTDRSCANGEIELSNATQVLGNYECQVSTNDVCITVGRLTPTLYNQMSGAVNISYGLVRYGPFLTELVDCSFLRDVFTRIHDDHCPDLNRYSKWVYIGLALVSAAVLFSLLFWVIYARERRHRKYTKLADGAAARASHPSNGP